MTRDIVYNLWDVQYTAHLCAGVHHSCTKNLYSFYRAFDLLNSHNPRAMGFKAPLRQATFQSQKARMIALSDTLMSVKLSTGKPVAQDGRRMSVISLAFTLKSVAELGDALLQRDMCR